MKGGSEFKIGILATEDYGEMLGKYIRNRLGKEAEIWLVSDPELIKDKDFFILIAEGKYIDRDLAGEHVFYLVEEDIADKENEIYRYQSAEKIFIEIFSRCGDKGSLTANYFTSPIITFYSLTDIPERMAMAVILAKALATSGKEILYLNFDTIDLNDTLFQSALNYGFSKVLIDAEDSTKNLSASILKNTSFDPSYNFHFLSSPVNFLEKTDLNIEIVEKMIVAATETDRFEYLVLDLDSSLNKMNLELLMKSRWIFYIYTDNPLSRRKMDSFLKDLHSIEKYKVIKPRIISVMVRMSESLGKEGRDHLEENIKISLDKDFYLEADNNLVMDQSSELIQKIAELQFKLFEKE